MKKLNKLVTLMIIIMVTAVLPVNAQYPGMENPNAFKPGLNGKIYVPPTNAGRFDLCAYNSTYTIPQGSPIVSNVMYEQIFTQQFGQKVKITLFRFVDSSKIATLNSLGVRFNHNFQPGGGNLIVSQNQNGTGWSKRFSLRLKESDVAYDTINTNDGTWAPANMGSIAGAVQVYQVTLDSVQSDVNGYYWLQIGASIDLLAYPQGTSPYRGLRYTLMNSWNLEQHLTPTSMIAPKKVSAYFASEVSNPGYIVGIDSLGTVFNAWHYPTNFYDSTNCDKLSIEAVEKSTGIIAATETWSPYWDLVDEVGTGQSRSDKTEHWTYFRNLKDTTKYQLRFKVNGNVSFTQEIITRAKAPKPAGIKPVFTDLIIKSKDATSVTVNLTFTRGTVDTTPYTLQLLDANGVVLPDFTVYVSGSGPASMDITRNQLYSFRDYSIVAKQGTTTLKSVSFKTSGVDAVLSSASLITTAVDVTPEIPVYTLSYTAGSIDAPGVARFIITVTGPSGQVAQYDKLTVAGQMTAQSLQIPMDFGVIANTDYTVSVSQVSYPDAVNLVTKSLGSFTFRKSSSSISGASVTGVSAYIDGSGMLQTAGVPERVTKQVYNPSGTQIGIFNESFDMNIYPSGIYFLMVDGQPIKFVK